MGQAGHDDRDIFHTNYQPRNAGVDGQATFLGQDRREAVNDAFRNLTLPRNPNLCHCLPAKKQYELDNHAKLLNLEEKMAALKLSNEKDSDCRKIQRDLYKEKEKFMARELRRWQKKQPYKPGDPAGYHREIFHRCSFMMLVRKRLSESMFEVANLRDSTGIQAILDMVALCEQEREVEFRPGLEPEKCSGFNYKDSKSNLANSHDSRDWKHIYDCYKTTLEQIHGFAELCFICNKWFSGEDAWKIHCEGHVNHLEAFPKYLDPLIFDEILAMPGFCYDCLTDPRLPASKRMHQFKNKKKWQTHVQGHIDDMDDRKHVRCKLQTQQCLDPFDSVLELQFHLQDVHGINTIKRRKWRKRSRYESDEGQCDKEKKRQPVKYKRKPIKSEEAQDQKWILDYAFVNSTIASMESISASSGTSKSPHYNSPSHGSARGSERCTQTPLPSVCDETPIDLEICSQGQLQSNCDDFVVIDTMEDDGIRQSDSVTSLDSIGLSASYQTTVQFLMISIDGIYVDGSVEITTSTATEYAQIEPECRLRIALSLDTDDLTFLDLTCDSDASYPVSSVIHSEFQCLADATSLSNLSNR
jgi:hypothetical protein